MDYKLDNITLNQLISNMYCSGCSKSNDRIEQLLEDTRLKEYKEISYSTGTTKIIRCPKCGVEIKICIPNNEVFWDMINSALNEDKRN